MAPANAQASSASCSSSIIAGSQIIGLEFRVTSLKALQEKIPERNYTVSPSVTVAEGSFRLKVFPNGDREECAGWLSIYVEPKLNMPGLEAVRLRKGWEIHLVDDEGVVLGLTKAVNGHKIANEHDSSRDYFISSGFDRAFRAEKLPDSFTIRCQGLYVGERISSKPTTPENPLKKALESKFEEIVAIARKPRLYTTAELQELNIDDLAALVERAREVIEMKREASDDKCPVCLQRDKTFAMVPCGHRACGQCVEKIHQCPQCRSEITTRLQLF